jgi:hypothetical protein
MLRLPLFSCADSIPTASVVARIEHKPNRLPPFLPEGAPSKPMPAAWQIHKRVDGPFGRVDCRINADGCTNGYVENFF